MRKSYLSALITTALITYGLLVAVPALANDGFVLDPEATTPGHLVEDAAGNAYVTWTHDEHGAGPDQPMFCKVVPGGTCTAPIALAIPGALSPEDETAAAFPVIGSGNIVYVVAPRYERNDVVVWTSVDGGASFGPGRIVTGAYSQKTTPGSVLLRSGEFVIGASNSGLGFSSGPIDGGVGSNFTFEAPGAGTVGGSSMALENNTGAPILAYWSISEPFRVSYYRYSGSGGLDTPSSWVGPIVVSNGYEPQLAGGAAGVFMVDQDFSTDPEIPAALTLRRFEGTGPSAHFGPGLVLYNDTTPTLFDGPAIGQSPTSGRIVVASPDPDTNPALSVIRLFTSTDGGATFSASEVAHINGVARTGEDLHVSVDDAGTGWVLFRDSSGLRLGDLSPLPPPAPPAAPSSPAPPSTPAPPAPPSTPPTPPTYSGPVKSQSTTFGSTKLTLSVPAQCVAAGQAFYVGVGSKVKKAHGGKAKVTSVTFSLDGKKVGTVKRKPFRQLLTVNSRGSHTVTSKVLLRFTHKGKKKTKTKTITGKVNVC